MNQAILCASSDLKSCIDEVAVGAIEGQPFMFIPFTSSTTRIAADLPTTPSQTTAIKRNRQKIGRIGITVRGRFSINFWE